MQKTINIESIWSKVYGKLFGYISKHAINKDDVNDIIQDTFLKVKTNINRTKYLCRRRYKNKNSDTGVFRICRLYCIRATREISKGCIYG